MLERYASSCSKLKAPYRYVIFPQVRSGCRRNHKRSLGQNIRCSYFRAGRVMWRLARKIHENLHHGLFFERRYEGAVFIFLILLLTNNRCLVVEDLYILLGMKSEWLFEVWFVWGFGDRGFELAPKQLKPQIRFCSIAWLVFVFSISL